MRPALLGIRHGFRNILGVLRLTGIFLTPFLWAVCAYKASAQDIDFPLRAAVQRSYLEDSQGQPFLIMGDSAWSMIADLSLAEAELYLDTRRQQGFNSILTSLIEHKFARNAPANFYREPPFIGDAFDQPNEAYFQRAEAIIEAAWRRNMLVLLCPAYLGADGQAEGWYQEMVAAGAEQLEAYGRYVGRRFGRFPNIIWVQGGDYDPPDKTLVNAIAEGIEAEAPNALQTVHSNRDTVTSVFWSNAEWLRLDTVYTYDDVGAAVVARRNLGPVRPFFLIEARYEAEHGIGESEIRLAAYGALLSGAGGQVFGNNPVWHFSSAGLFESPLTWRQALASPGARSITALAKLFSGLDWWKLVPDQGALLKTAGGGSGEAFAARDVEGQFALIYVRDRPAVVLDLDGLARGKKELRWYDPSSGSFLADTEHFEGGGVQNVAVPGKANRSGFHDWVGILANDDHPLGVNR
jgi:hypothetical protein